MSDTNTTNNVHPNDNGKSKSKPRAKPKANTDGQGSIDLSARDTELLVAALKNLKSELSLQVCFYLDQELRSRSRSTSKEECLFKIFV